MPPIAVLPLPTEDDNLPSLIPKLSSYLYVIHIGRCLAAATGYIATGSHRQIPESRAVSQMTPYQRECFQECKEGRPLPLPHMDWDVDRRHTLASPRPMKKSLRRAEALNRIYQTNRAEPCYYTYFVENHPLWLPLVTTIARIIGAEKNQDGLPTRLPRQKG